VRYQRHEWEFAQHLLQCVAVFLHPLRVEKLAEFLPFGFKAGLIPKFHEDWRPEDPMESVLSTCSTLLAVINVDDLPVIQLSHFLVKEFLTTISGLSLPVLGVCRKMYAKGRNGSRNASKSHFVIWLWIFDPRILSCNRVNRVQAPLSPRGISLHYAAFCGLHDIVMVLVIESSQNVVVGFSKARERYFIWLHRRNTLRFLCSSSSTAADVSLDLARFLVVEYGAGLVDPAPLVGLWQSCGARTVSRCHVRSLWQPKVIASGSRCIGHAKDA
jgi:hypothetical protein